MKTFSENFKRNVEKIYPNPESLEKRLKNGPPLKIYLGIDPSSSRIHLGNAILLWKLKQFQAAGHKIILLIGDFTGMIGDPTDRSATRQPLTREQVRENSKNYQEQASKILNFSGDNPAEIHYNSTWLDKLNFVDLINLSALFTLQQFVERDMFQKRLKENKPIGLHEFLYPLMQGYDSVALEVDMEVGGTDQTFNMLVGRDLVQKLQGREKFVLTVPLLEGTDGRKMSKSFGNSVDISDSPGEMFGKIMSLKDELVLKYFQFCTQVEDAKLKEIEIRLKKENPINIKKELAREIVTLYHAADEAEKAEAEFERVVQNKEMPTVIEEVEINKNQLPNPTTFASLTTLVGLTSSISEAVRLAEQGGLFFDNKKVDNARENFEYSQETVIQAGKRRFKKVKFV